MNLIDRPMTPVAFAGMLSAAKIEIMAMAENLFNRRSREMQAEIVELQKMVINWLALSKVERIR